MTPQWDPITKQLIDGDTGMPIEPGTNLGNGFVVPGVPTTNAPSPTAPVTAPLVAPSPTAPEAASPPATAPASSVVQPSALNNQSGVTSLASLTTVADSLPTPAGLQPNDPYVLAKQAAKVTDGNVVKAQGAVDKAQANYDAISKSPNSGALGQDVKSAGDQLTQALQDRAAAWKSQADSYTKVADAATAALSRAKDPDLKNYYQSNSVDALARAHLADVQAAGFKDKNDADVARTRADTDAAIQDMEDKKLLTPAQAELARSQSANLQATTQRTLTLLSGDVAQQGATLNQTNAQTTLTNATTTKTEADAALSLAQAKVQDAAGELARATLPSDIALAQTKLDAANQQLQQAKELEGGLVKQQGATLANTQAGTENTQATAEATRQGTLKAQQGAQFGLEQKRDQLIAMVRANEIDGSPGGEADQMWAQAIAQAQGAGTPLEEENAANVRRQQDASLAGTQASTFGSIASNAFSTMGAMNKDAPAGSSAMAYALHDYLNRALSQIQGIGPKPGTGGPAMLQPNAGWSTPASVPPPVAAPVATDSSAAPAASVAPPPSADPAAVVHAAVSAALGNSFSNSVGGGGSIGGGATYGGMPIPGTSGTPPPGASAPAMLAGAMLGTPAHVNANWGVGQPGGFVPGGGAGGLASLDQVPGVRTF